MNEDAEDEVEKEDEEEEEDDEDGVEDEEEEEEEEDEGKNEEYIGSWILSDGGSITDVFTTYRTTTGASDLFAASYIFDITELAPARWTLPLGEK